MLSPELIAYLEAHLESESEILRELNRETHAKVLQPRMLSGHLQGRLLALFSKLIRPRNILEVGTYTGYAALCLAEGLAEGGQLHTIEVNEEREKMIRTFIQKAGKTNEIVLHLGDAREVIAQLDREFQLAFVDADKMNYSTYFDLILPKMSSNGLIIVDNVLWSGKVLAEQEKLDKKTASLRAFNQKVKEDNRVESYILPIRDGLLLARVC